ncbi:ATP-binding protein [Streptomyces sp. NPDC051567]|uniref:ATP-binding protein n=1 Tax=Streptomyces sp. NPDC051567 TaxID=3365660 RepID=UPI0037B99AC2
MTQTTTPLALPPSSATTEAVGGIRRTADLMCCSFVVQGRAVGEPVPDVDARRVGEVRRVVDARLGCLGLGALRDSVLLVVSELVTNAVEHTADSGGGCVTVTQVSVRGGLRIEVRDEAHGHPQVRAPGLESERGRGLHLVDLVTAELGGRWGHSPGTGTVWCTIPTTIPVTPARP